MPPGVAQAALLANWRRFGVEGGLRAGRPTQGVFGEDIRWLDPYSGPASSLWGTRSLVAHLALDAAVNWQRRPPRPLPAAACAGSVQVRALQAQVVRDGAHSELVFDAGGPVPHGAANPAVRLAGTRDRWRQWLLGVAVRPANNLRKLGRRVFSSRLSEYR